MSAQHAESLGAHCNQPKVLKSPHEPRAIEKQLKRAPDMCLPYPEALSQSRFPQCPRERKPPPGEGRPGSWHARSHTGGLQSACCQIKHHRPPNPPETQLDDQELISFREAVFFLKIYRNMLVKLYGGLTCLIASTTASGNGAVFPTQVAQP